MPGEIVVDELPGNPRGNAELLRKAERPLPVNDAEVDGLRLAAHLRGDHFRENAEHLAGGPGMDVLVAGKGITKDPVFRQVGKDPELDLRIVRRQQQAPLFRNEGVSNLAPLLAPDRDVLKVRIGRGEPAGVGHRLVVGGVDPAGSPLHELRQGIGIGRFQLVEAPVLEDQPDDLMFVGQPFEDRDIGGKTCLSLGLLAGRKPHPYEQGLAELFGGVDVELAAGAVVNVMFQGGELCSEAVGEVPEQRQVEFHPRQLHFGQDLDQRHLHFVKKPFHPLLLEAGPELQVQEIGGVGVLAGIAGRALDRDVGKVLLLLPRTGHFGIGDHPVVEKLQGERIEPVARTCRVQQVGGDHGVEPDPLHFDAGPAQDLVVVLEVLADLPDAGIGQKLRESRQHPVCRELPVRIGGVVADRDIESLMVGSAQGYPDDIRLAGVETGGLQVNGKGARLPESRQKRGERGVIQNRAVPCHGKGFGTGQFLHQGGETVFLEEFRQPPVVGRRNRQIVVAPGKRHLSINGGKPSGKDRLGGKLPQLLPHFPLHFSGPRQESIQGAELLDQLDGGLLADTGNARDVVGGVARQAEDIDHPAGLDAEPLLHLPEPALFLLHGVQEADLTADDLHQVLVAGNHHDRHPPLLAVPGNGGDNVVRLVACHFQGRDIEGAHQFLDRTDLGHEIVGHGCPVGLVFGVEFIPEGEPAGIEDYRQVVRLPVLHYLEKHLGEPVEGIGGKSPGGGKVTYGVIGPVDVRRTVDQIEQGLTGHFFFSSRVKTTNAMDGRLLDSRIANCMPSNRHPWGVHSFSTFASSSSVTELTSTTLYSSTHHLRARIVRLHENASHHPVRN